MKKLFPEHDVGGGKPSPPPYVGRWKEPWERIEEGLTALKEELAPEADVNETDRDTAVPSPSIPMASTQPETGRWRALCFGLQLDDSRQVVRREGCEAEVDLGSRKLLWGLLCKFLDNHDVPLNVEALQPVWSTCGQATRPAKGTVTDAVATLREKLKPLKIEITNKRKLGWKLKPS